MLTERASALMFQNYEKYVNKNSIFNKVAPLGYNCIKNELLFFTETELYSETCQTSKMKGFARIFIGFLVVNYIRKTLRLKYLDLNTPLDRLVVDKTLEELLFFENSFY